MGTGSTGGHGLCGDCRLAAASRALHAGGGAFGLRTAWDRTPPECWAYLGHGGLAGFVGGRGAGSHGGHHRLRSRSLPGLRNGLCFSHRPGFSGSGPGKARFYHAVPVQAGDGRLCDGHCHLRGSGTAQQAVWRNQTRGQHRGKARGDHQTASRGQLDNLCGGSHGIGVALPAAAREQEDPGRPGGAFWSHCAERRTRFERQLRRRGGWDAAQGAAIADHTESVRSPPTWR